MNAQTSVKISRPQCDAQSATWILRGRMKRRSKTLCNLVTDNFRKLEEFTQQILGCSIVWCQFFNLISSKSREDASETDTQRGNKTWKDTRESFYVKFKAMEVIWMTNSWGGWGCTSRPLPLRNLEIQTTIWRTCIRLNESGNSVVESQWHGKRAMRTQFLEGSFAKGN